MNGNRNHLFRLSCGFDELYCGHTTFREIRRRGDRFATTLNQRVRLEGYNTPLTRWEGLGTFLGNREFIDAFGDHRTSTADYSGTARKGGDA